MEETQKIQDKKEKQIQNYFQYIKCSLGICYFTIQ